MVSIHSVCSKIDEVYLDRLDDSDYVIGHRTFLPKGRNPVEDRKDQDQLLDILSAVQRLSAHISEKGTDRRVGTQRTIALMQNQWPKKPLLKSKWAYWHKTNKDVNQRLSE